MRVAVISDIHGNRTALEAVLQDLTQQPAVDHIVVAGDLCLNGPYPKEVLAMIKDLQCPVIQGNVDREVVAREAKPKSKKLDTIDWTRDQIGDEGVAYLASLPFSHTIKNPQGSNLLVVHANPLNQDDAIVPTASEKELERFLGTVPLSIGSVAYGHYHVAYQRRWRHLLLVDVGSCGIPRDEDVRASYAILTWKHSTWYAEHRRIPYDRNAVVHQLKVCGIPHVEKRIHILTTAKY